MADNSRPHILYEMTWEEFQEAVREHGDRLLALIPAGSTEQHGPHGSFGVDTGRAEEYTRLLAGRLHPRAIAIPAMPFGVSPHHMKFPGTITLSSRTFIQVLHEVVASLYEHGIRRFFFLNGHGGNASPLNVLMADLQQEFKDVKLGWASFTQVAHDVIADEVDSIIRGHACEGEMSQAMYLAPWSVREDLFTAGDIQEAEEDYVRPPQVRAAIQVYRTFDQLTANGALGDARKSRKELGEKIVKTSLDRLAGYLEDF